MLKYFAFAVLLTLAEAGDVAGSQSNDGSPQIIDISKMSSCCLKNTYLSSFNMSRFSGTWYKWSYYDTILFDRNCIDVSFDVSKENLMSSETTWFRGFECEYIVEKDYYIQPDPSQPAKFKSSMTPWDPSDDTDFWILGTDYTSWAVVYHGCRIADDKCKMYTAIWMRFGRDKDQDIFLNDHTSDVLRAHALDPSKFINTECHAC